MKQWHTKELGALANISVRTLHHYDRIGLLKPSGRSSNGYRWYGEKDLARLQQIVALKFFGFSLTEIKKMLENNPDIISHLQKQTLMINDQIKNLEEVRNSLTTVINKINNSQNVVWSDFITLIERYDMQEEIKKGWAGNALNESLLSKWTTIWEKNPHLYKIWQELTNSVNSGLLGDPEGPDGEKIIEEYTNMATLLIQKSSFEEQVEFNAEIAANIKNGSLTTLPLSPEGQLWFSKACVAYNLKKWQQLYQEITNHIQEDPTGPAGKKLADTWRSLIAPIKAEKISPDFIIGTMAWQQLGEQHAQLQNRTTPITPQEVFSKAYCNLVFDAAALNWIRAALNTDQGTKND